MGKRPTETTVDPTALEYRRIQELRRLGAEAHLVVVTTGSSDNSFLAIAVARAGLGQSLAGAATWMNSFGMHRHVAVVFNIAD
ncbi:hypothetical protein BaRGS_00013156 [Batillaria attramentaria]|uniref:Uncharacterized protein n=1 Tax=Batillaria attramentaria TaxID=370345 RepID=A0ABD0L8H8_9CAEN